MKKRDLTYLKIGSGILIGIVILGIIAFSIYKLFFINKQVVEAPKPSKTIEEIQQENSSDLSKAETEGYKAETAEDIYSIVHQMSNTLIVPEDGLIFGEVPISDKMINDVMGVINKTEKIDKNEKEILLNILDRWKHKDYSQAVNEHNYVWKKLNGNVGRAKDLRPEYKK